MKQETIKILSIDGGGIRGIIPALLLAEIEKQTGKKISDCFDFIAGTSTGAIIALLINLKESISAQQIVNIYEEYGKVIFKRNKLRSAVRGPKYSVDGLNRVIEKFAGNTFITDTVKPVLITAYETEQQKTTFFTNYQNRYKDLLIKDAIRASTAAPSYFEPVKIPNRGTFIDGGMGANNPAMCAYVEVVKLLKRENKDVNNVRIAVVSLGAGQLREPYRYEQLRRWHGLNWLFGPILNILFEANNSTVQYQLKQLLSDKDYYRFQLALPVGHDAIDNASKSNLDVLKSLAAHHIKTQWLEQINDVVNLINSDESSLCNDLTRASLQKIEQ